ncbi:MarC family protein [Acidihalobacter aeolianus]|nr:MarC family protein [Acidihalobacter aeolianus]
MTHGPQMTLFSAALLFFLVMDPFGNIPLFLSALRQTPRERQPRVIVREMLIALVILLVFMFFGQQLMDLLEVSPAALGVAGGVVLFLIALKMVFPDAGGLHEQIEGEPLVVPLAVPLIAGPSAISAAMLMASRQPGDWPLWTGALLIAWAASGSILLAATRLSRHLGARGLVALERLMGLILTVIAVQMLLSGIAQFLHLTTAQPAL